jgi:aspartyl-tRNA(Asn)/glutamyl-tRNA(Gln) amidotransferase subunit A
MHERQPLTAAQASRAIAAGKLTASELLESCLERIASHDKQLHSFVLLTAASARRAAAAADRAISAGKRIGSLHGIPYAAKDIFETKGVRTTAHSRILLRHVPKRDAVVVARLKAAGAILVGKVATHEFATGGPAFDLPFPPARNPWNPEYFTGGSSSGSAASVGGGLVPLALGSDTTGSIRGPAALCGIAGFKPTYGLVPRTGVLPLAFSLDHVGPMAWTVEDCALMLQAIAGHDGRDPACADRPIPDFLRGLKRSVSGMRVGVVRHFYERDLESDPVAVEGIEDALRVLRRLGARLVDVTLPPQPDWDACSRIITMAEAYTVHQREMEGRPERYAAITRARLSTGADLKATDYIRAQQWRRRLVQTYASAMEGLDALVTAAAVKPASKIVPLAKPPYFAVRGAMLMAPFNVVGAPALSVCAGFTAEGLPLSIQFAGRPYEDATVLQLGHAYERATPWRRLRPQL